MKLACSARRSTLTLALVGAALVGSVGLAPASHAATGTYSNGSVVPAGISNVRIGVNSSKFSVPSTVASTAKVSTVSASYSYMNKPANYTVAVWLCYDSANQDCLQIPSTSGTYGSSGTFNTSVWSGRAAKTAQWHFWTYVNDGQTSTTHAAMNPAMWAPNNSSNSAFINYTY